MNKDSEQVVPNDEISLKELILKGKEWFNYLVSQWKIILLAGIVGAALGLTYSFIKKPVYTASLTFAVEDEKSGSGLGGALGLASSFGLDLGVSGGGVFEGSNLIELFKSRSMVEQTLLSPVSVEGDTISLAEMYLQNQGWREDWEEDPDLKSIVFQPTVDRAGFTRAKDSILGVIYTGLSKDGLTVGQRDKKIAIITVDVHSTDELFAKNFTENLVENVSDFYKSTKSKKARDNMAILEKQTDSVRNELNKAITGVAVANDNTFGLNPALNVKRTPSARRQVDVQANTAILTELVKQGELAKVTVRKETPLIQIIDRPILPLRKDKFSSIKGVVFGGFIAVFLFLFFLIVRRALKRFLE
jgi:hypothetical protein